MRVRRATAADIPAIIALERQTPAAAHWSQQQYEQIFTRHASEAVTLIAEGEPPTAATDDPPILAFLTTHCIDAEWELQNLVVAESYRRKGLATLLLKELLSIVQSRNGRMVFLEVRQSNLAARAFYKKLRFAEISLRKSYYSNPPEDAIICRLTF